MKVIDLGMARLVENDIVVTDDVLGTTGYHAPEVLFDESYDFRSDIFVLGITFCVMVWYFQVCISEFPSRDINFQI